MSVSGQAVCAPLRSQSRRELLLTVKVGFGLVRRSARYPIRMFSPPATRCAPWHLPAPAIGCRHLPRSSPAAYAAKRIVDETRRRRVRPFSFSAYGQGVAIGRSGVGVFT